MTILNKNELDSWLFEHSNIQGNTCLGVKSEDVDEKGLKYNVAFIDNVTKERFEIIRAEYRP